MRGTRFKVRDILIVGTRRAALNKVQGTRFKARGTRFKVKARGTRFGARGGLYVWFLLAGLLSLVMNCSLF